ncbi:MAG TPA: rhomboid family intramembrane serine protease [Kofleriaceae bacterium]
MLPRLGTSKLVTNWLLITLGASVANALGGGWLASWAALAPSRILRGEVWRLVTWPLIEVGPMALIFTCVAIYKFGGELAIRWGDVRLRRFMLEIVVGAGVATCLLAAIAGATYMRRLGGWAVADVLVIAWARQFPDRSLVLYGLLTLRGQQLINITVGAAILFAIYFGPIAMAPELIACAAAALYPTERLRY